MHEFSIAASLLDEILLFAGEHEGAEILQVRLEIGELMCVEAEQLRFCYDSIKQLTPAQNSSLVIEVVPAMVHCQKCHYEGRPKYWEGALANAAIPTLQCPQCGRSAEAIAGDDCAIRSVQLLDPGNDPPLLDNNHETHECDPFRQAVPAELERAHRRSDALRGFESGGPAPARMDRPD